MNDPIISPWLVYLIGQSQTIADFLCIIGTIALIMASIALIVAREELDWPLSSFLLLIIPIIVVIAGVLIPSSKTIAAMIVANNVTPNTLKNGIELTETLKDEIKQDIIDIIIATKEEVK